MAVVDQTPASLVPLTTARLRLRALTADDVDAVFAILGDEQTTARVSWRQPSRAAAQGWLARRMAQEVRHGLSMWAVDLLDGGGTVGLCGFLPAADDPGTGEIELGYVVKASVWGRGYATEAATAAVGAAHRAGRTVYATIRPWNAGSVRVAERAGLHADGSVDDERGPLLVYRSRR